MGVLIDGVWTDGELPQETGETGQLKRVDSSFRDRITADGSTGFKAEPGRYHLYVAHGCPWAHRTLIYRALKKLDGLISVAYSIPGLKQKGWTFENDPRFPDCVPDTVNGFHYLYEAYVATNKNYTGKVTVPTLWDAKTRRIVNNESSEIIRMFNTAFAGIAEPTPDYYPEPLRSEIDATNALVKADKAAVESAKAQVLGQKSVTENARVQLGYCDIRSPIDGRTGKDNIYYRDNMWRIEHHTMGPVNVSIVRKDKQVVWMLLSRMKRFKTLSYSAEQDLWVTEKLAGEVSREEIGQEAREGAKTEPEAEDGGHHQWVIGTQQVEEKAADIVHAGTQRAALGDIAGGQEAQWCGHDCGKGG